MEFVTTTITLIGVVIGAAFVIAGGVLIPLWHLNEDRDHPKGDRS
ncbi:hypothetical protein [Stackebrandtia soli]